MTARTILKALLSLLAAVLAAEVALVRAVEAPSTSVSTRGWGRGRCEPRVLRERALGLLA